MAILNKLEQEVVNALMSQGRTENEANTIVRKLKKGSEFVDMQSDIEVSKDGRLVALYPATALAISRTGLALLVEWNGQELWFPLKQIDPTSEVMEKDDCGILVMSAWIAEKKGLIENGQPVSTTQTQSQSV